jgi:Protein of unknown function, DUF599
MAAFAATGGTAWADIGLTLPRSASSSSNDGLRDDAGAFRLRTRQPVGAHGAYHPDHQAVRSRRRAFQSRAARIFFALGYLGWFVSPWVLFVTTAMVVAVIWRRQFASNAWRAMAS